jgi:membrane-bound metal-dependent hydrolase YbcI (DUF457 family)
MFIGHLAVGFAAKSIAPKPSLGTYCAAVSFLDLLWPLFLLLGIEHVKIDPGNTAVTPLAFIDYPFSHSLLMTILWALLFALSYYVIRRDIKGGLWLLIAVVSHWILDAITHRPDLPLTPGRSTLIGFELWNSLPGTMVTEFLLFVMGVALYLRSTKTKDRTGAIALWSFIGVIVGMYIANLFGPPPPDARFLAWFALSGWLIVFWGWWIERHRERIAIR